MTNKLVLLSTILLLFLCSCKYVGVKGSGVIEEKIRNLSNFDKIEVAGSFKVSVNVGESTSLKIIAEDNLIEFIETDVKNGTLFIQPKSELTPTEEMRINISTPTLFAIECSGANSVDVQGIKNENFRVDLSGAGNVNLSGTAEVLNVGVSGAANLEAKELITRLVKIDLSGAANAIVYAEESINASVSGVGNINYYGNPTNVQTDVSGIGSINRK